MVERVLLVEDDPSIRALATMILEHAGLAVDSVADGDEALERVRTDAPALVLLDVMLPGIDGFEVCRRLRSRTRIPIVMLTARDSTADLVTGLELGADDYVTKPFEAAELVARIRAVLRRAGATSDVVEVGDLVVDRGAHLASRDGHDLDLSAMEFRLLSELVDSAGQVLTREELLQRVWGYDYLGDSRLVDMGIKRLRDKLGDRADEPRYVTTVRRVGYRFERQPEGVPGASEPAAVDVTRS